MTGVRMTVSIHISISTLPNLVNLLIAEAPKLLFGAEICHPMTSHQFDQVLAMTAIGRV